MAEAVRAVQIKFDICQDTEAGQKGIHILWLTIKRYILRRIRECKDILRCSVYPTSLFEIYTLGGIFTTVTWYGWNPGYIWMWNIQPVVNRFVTLSPSSSVLLNLSFNWIRNFSFFCAGWVTLRQFFLKRTLSYHGWMLQERGRVSIPTQLWSVLLRIQKGSDPYLFSNQAVLPTMPVPELSATIERYLQSKRPLMSEDDRLCLESMARCFEYGIGQDLQSYIKIKALFSSNYVSDWWETYVYLYSRAPIMINSNYYGLGEIGVSRISHPASRAANIVFHICEHMRNIHRGELKPLILQGMVPLCSAQYERQFCTVRLPGKTCDVIEHYHNSRYIVVYNRGRYYTCDFSPNGRYLMPIELERQFDFILNDKSPPYPGETHLAAFTAGERTHWHESRKSFLQTGINKKSLSLIEKACFVLVFDDEAYPLDFNDSKLIDNYAKLMLHGKGYDRWFDKSFNIVVGTNGQIGFNAEHSWADAPIMGHMWEYACSKDYLFAINPDGPFGYNAQGRCFGTARNDTPDPIRLEWDIGKECQAAINQSLGIANDLIRDVDLHVVLHNHFGKGFIKKCQISPDAFIQMALQLAYFRNANEVCLTYEASMMRLFKEGRTETVRSCTVESTSFVKAMQSRTTTKEARLDRLRNAAAAHVSMYKQAMVGQGVDRHLFVLYVMSKYLQMDSPFLSKVFSSDKWRLSTSQTPTQQTNLLNPKEHTKLIGIGGGFGPVDDYGYGVSYIISGENNIFFHISSKKSCPTTSSTEFGNLIVQAMADIKALFD